MKRFGIEDFGTLAEGMRRASQDAYYAMYSSVYGGVVTDPALMLVPADDHVVHRGDGVFETLKCVDGAIYNMAAHLDRLTASAQALAFELPWDAGGIRDIVIETIRAGDNPDCLVRLIISRGPGSFSVNPYDCERPALYVVAYRLKEPFMTLHPEGATVATSSIPLKPDLFACVKGCNYLPNALMKKEAVDAGVDFVLAFDERGFLAEGATENVGIVTPDKALLFPREDRILRGTTVLRVVELAGRLVEQGELSGVGFDDIARGQVEQAAELLMVGTTPDVTAAVKWDGRVVGDGTPGPVQRVLNRLLVDDVRTNPAYRTVVFG